MLPCDPTALFYAFRMEASIILSRPQLPVNQGLCEDKLYQRALKPQLTTEGSACDGVAGLEPLTSTRPLVNKADPVPWPQTTGPGWQVTWHESCAQRKGQEWPGPFISLPCDNHVITAWNHVKPTMFLGSRYVGEKSLG